MRRSTATTARRGERQTKGAQKPGPAIRRPFGRRAMHSRRSRSAQLSSAPSDARHVKWGGLVRTRAAGAVLPCLR